MSIQHPLPIGTAVRFEDTSYCHISGCGFIIDRNNSNEQKGYFVGSYPWLKIDPDTRAFDNVETFFMYFEEIVEVLS